MSDILLDYFFPISSVDPIPQASTAFLKQVAVVVSPKIGVETGVAVLCTSPAEVAVLTDNTDVQQLFNAGMSRVFVLPMDDLDLADALEGADSEYYTLLISSDFTNENIEDDLDVGTFKGVVGLYSNDKVLATAEAVKTKRCAFYGTTITKARNLFFAFGKLLSNQLNWSNQQYIQMPFADDVDTLGEAESLFDDRVSFVISSAQFGQRLGLFCAGAKAIIAPYILRNFEIDMQSRALTYISANQPQYTITQATLLEDELNKVITLYIERGWITSGKIEVKLQQSNFVASGFIEVSEPTALWRIFGEVRQG
jgi:hypothetical protein